MGEGCPPIWIDGRERVDCEWPSDHPGRHGARVTIDTYNLAESEVEVFSEDDVLQEQLDAWVTVRIEWEDGLMSPSSVFPSGVTSGRSA